MTVRRVLFALTALAFSACAKPSDMGSGSGGSNGTGGGSSGGSTGSGGSSTSTGGNSGPPAGLDTGKGFSFPQNKTSGACMLATGGSTASSQTQSAYSSWLSTYVTSSGAPSGAKRVIDPQSLSCNGKSVSNGTVSEGIGYGMLAAVYMADQATFDALWAYASAHLDSHGLMNWCIDSSGNTVGAFSATDGDEDMIWALLMASDQWSSTTYFSTAVNMINAMRANSLISDGTVEVGDNAMTANMMHHDYFSPAYYRVFAKAANDPFWAGIVIDRNYTHLANVTGSDGLVPDASNFQDMIASSSSTCMSCSPNYGYDACRMPWRIAMDYCFNGEARALTYLQKVGAFFDGQKVANIGDGYSASGSKVSGNRNMAFVGPAGVAGMVNWPNLLNDAFNYGATNPTSGNDSGNAAYFPQSLRVVTMLMMSGNFLDYSQM